MSTIDLEDLRAKALSDGKAQGWRQFGGIVGVDGETLRQFATSKAGRKAHPDTLTALRRHYAPPLAVPNDYWRGVLYAAEAMAETTARLLREARHADEETVRQTARAVLFGTLPASESARQGTSATGPSRAPLPRAAKNV